MNVTSGIIGRAIRRNVQWMALCATLTLPAVVQAATILQTGSQYNTTLANSDGDVTLIWSGNQLLDAGTLSSYSFYARTTAAIRPLLIAESGGSYSVVGIGNAFTPAATGYQSNIPFTLSSGVSSYNTSGGTRYYLGMSNVSGTSPVAWATSNETAEGQPVFYKNGSTSTLGAMGSLLTLSGANARYYRMTANSQLSSAIEVIGSELVNRSFVDGSGVTLVRVDAPFTMAGQVSKWMGFADVTASRTITPLIFKNGASAGTYDIVGIGQARTFTSRGNFEFDFNLQSGSSSVLAGYYLGFWDSANAGGVVPWSDTGASIPTNGYRYFTTGASALSAGQNLVAVASPLTREYSIAFVVIPEPSSLAMMLFGVIGLWLMRKKN